jgi:hypothetical protein
MGWLFATQSGRWGIDMMDVFLFFGRKMVGLAEGSGFRESCIAVTDCGFGVIIVRGHGARRRM